MAQVQADTHPIFQSLDLLLQQARQDHGGSHRAAQFLLSLWNGNHYKADLQALLYNDGESFQAMIDVLTILHREGNQLYTYVTEDQMKPIIAAWGKSFMKSRG